MIARERPRPIPYLRNVERWIWLLVGGGVSLFFAIVVSLHVFYPGTPANELVTWSNAWLFVLPAAMTGMGVYTSVRWWCCPYCRRPLRAKGPLPERCPQCRHALVEPTEAGRA